ESRQPDFKVGIFGSKKKTNAEKKSRQESFLQDLQESMQAKIEWRFREKGTNLLKNYGVTDPEVLDRVQQLHIDYTAENVLNLINPGAKVNGKSVLHYSDEVSQDIKQRYKQEALSLLEWIN